MPKQKPSELIDNAENIAVEMSLSKARAEAASWKRKCKDALTLAASFERRSQVLSGIPADPTIQRFSQPLKGKPRGVAVVVPATDWHVEEQVSSETTNGKNEFNLSIAEARIKRFYQKVLRLIDWQNRLAPVVEIWHPLLGDLLSGYIHEDLVESNLLSPTEACVFLQEMICSGIDFWLRKTKLPIFIPTCIGNHGRTTSQKRIKTSCQNSFEWLLYMTLAKYYAAKYYAGSKRVHWRIGKGYHNTVEIMGRKVRFHHGDNLRYQGGVGGISIPVNKAISQWDKVETVDFDIFGHWHTFLANYPKWVACGSLMGFSEYSVAIKAEYQAPTQTFMVIDRDYGMTLATPIFVTESARKQREERKLDEKMQRVR